MKGPFARTLLSQLVLIFLVAGGAIAVAQEQGKPWTGEPGVTETVAAIMSRAGAFESLVPREVREPRPEPKVPKHDRFPNPASPDLSQWPPKPVPAPPVVLLNPQTVGTNFLGAQSSESGFIPPDSQGDVGPTQIIVCVNGRIKVFDRAGVLGSLNTTTDNFFSSVANGSGTSDPRVRYDRLTQRWFITMINVSTPNRVLIAVSSGPTITGTSDFTFYQFQHDLVGTTPNTDTGGFADYNLLGLDVNALYIGQNVFNAAGTAVIGTTVFVVRKSSVLSGGPIVITAFRQIGSANGTGAGIWTPQGVDNDDPTATEGYYIGTDNVSFGLLVVRRISTPGGTPSISANMNITVPSTTGPINVPHPGGTSSNTLDGLDDRLFAASLFKDKVTGATSLWTAHNIQVNSSGVASSSGGRNGSRWYQLSNLTSTPTLVQSGTLFDAAATTPLSYWIPSVAMSGQGHMALGTSRANRTTSAGVAVAGRLATDALGTTQSPTLAQTGVGNYTLGLANPRRWGDYSLVRVDPNDNQTMWTFQEYVVSDNVWGVRVVQLKAPPPAALSSASPATLTQGTPSADVVITGTSASGSGYFDPGPDGGGPGFPNHISATVTGGVVVNTVTVNSPTQVTLNVSTAGVLPGSKDVTIMNPDGQSATGTGLLTVISGTPAITVTAPNGGENWPVGSPQTITWVSNGVSGNVNIDLSTDGGSTFPVTLFAGAANDGTEPWTVTGPASATARVRITSVSDPTIRDSSNANFTMVQPTVTVVSPNGGEVWTVGSPQTLTWTSTNLTGNVKIELSTDGGSTFPAIIAANTANDGSEPWTVSGPASSAARIRVSSIAVPGVADASNGDFTMAQPAITVTIPNGGETWLIGSSQNIQWSSSAVSGNVKIELSTDGGSTFPTVLFASTANDGTEPWTVAGPSTTTARVRISSVTTPSVLDVSDANFTMGQVGLTVTAPNGGESWEVGSTQTVTWTSTGVSGQVMIELSRDGGSAYETIFPTTPNDGSEQWLVSGPPTSNGVIRISSLSAPLVSDISNGPFTISPLFTFLAKIRMQDNGGEADSVEYGTAAGATDGIDPLYGEFEMPPLPPGGLDVRWHIPGTLGTKRDMRDTLGGTRQRITYECLIQPGAAGYPLLVRWNHTVLPEGSFTLRYLAGGSVFLVNMKNQDSLVLTDENTLQFQIFYDLGYAVYANAQAAWNILSVPVTVGDRRKTTLFPTAISNAFAYGPTGYVIRDTLDYGVGYWLKFPSAQALFLAGDLRALDTIDVVQGWNIIGSISSPLPAGSIVQIPGGIVVSPYFSYAGGMYVTTTTITPLQGYWVKVNQAGRLVLGGATPSSSRKPGPRK